MVNKLPQGINNTIDDAIQFLGGTLWAYNFSNEQLPTVAINQYDLNIVKSLAMQLERNLALTEKQGEIGLRIVKRYEPALRKIGFDTETLITKKVFARPFRVIDKTKTLHIDGDQIVCKSPFIADLVNKFKKRKKHVYLAGTYNGENKEWSFPFNEKNIEFLLDAVRGKGFSIDENLTDIKKKTDTVKKEGLKYFPLLTIQDNKFTINNSDIPANYLQPFKDIDDPVEAILYSKMLGVTVYDSPVVKKLGHKTFRKILLGDQSRWTVNRKVHERQNFLELIKPSKQTLIMVSSVEHESLIKWIELLEWAGLSNQTSVAFRYPKNKEMNDYIKDRKVNKFDPESKIILTNEKINKNFVKYNITPNVVIVDLATEPSHYKTQTYLANKPLLVHYTFKGDSASGIL